MDLEGAIKAISRLGVSSQQTATNQINSLVWLEHYDEAQRVILSMTDKMISALKSYDIVFRRPVWPEEEIIPLGPKDLHDPTKRTFRVGGKVYGYAGMATEFNCGGVRMLYLENIPPDLVETLDVSRSIKLLLRACYEDGFFPSGKALVATWYIYDLLLEIKVSLGGEEGYFGPIETDKEAFIQRVDGCVVCSIVSDTPSSIPVEVLYL